MPIVRINGKLVHFAHVPKCAGTAVERYLSDRFGADMLGFIDRSFHRLPRRRRWNKSSPQHIPRTDFARMFPDGFFDARFAVVRHPVDRLVSVFRYHRDIEQLIDPETGFQDWLDGLTEAHRKQPFYLDNHARPMTEFVPDGAKVFRIEDGTGPILRWLDKLAGDQKGPRRIGRRNTYDQRLKVDRRDSGPDAQVTPAARARIADLFAPDFERFGYEGGKP